MVNSNKDSKNVVPQTEDEKNAEAQESLAKSAKYISDAMQRRQDRFDNPVETSQVDVRKERQRLIDSLTEEKPNLDPDQKPIDNLIPVKHNGEEPGESDKGESPELVKIREDVKDFVPQPPEHRVPPADQLNGETGDCGVMPVEARERQNHPLAVDADVETDPEGKAKGLKTLSDGSTIDAEGDKHLQQPEGHRPPQNADAKTPEDDSAARLDARREEYKKAFGKPANARWSEEHIQKLIEEKK